MEVFIMLWWMPWAIGAVMLGALKITELGGDSVDASKPLSELLADIGYIKFHDRKSKTYGVELKHGSSFKDLENLKGKIENIVKSEVNIINNNFNYYIQLKETSKELPTNLPFYAFDTKDRQGLQVAVGLSVQNGDFNILAIDFVETPHTLIAGTTGWGKSVFLINLILQIIHNYPECEFELLDFKGGVELNSFKNLKQTKSFTIAPDKAEEEISRIYSEIEERLDVINESESKNWIDHNKHNDNKLNPKFVIIEEFTILIDQSKDLKNILIKSLAISRAVGIFYVFTSQRFDSKIIDSRIKANIDNRICFHTADSINSSIILDQTGAEKLKNKGRALFSIGGQVSEGQTSMATDDDVTAIIKDHLKPSRRFANKQATKNISNYSEATEEPKISTKGVLIYGVNN